MNNLRPSIMEVDEKSFLYNIKSIKQYIGNNIEIMPVIKANAYGTFMNKRIKIMNKFNIVAIAIAAEAIQLRNDGYKNQIFVLNQPSIYEIETLINNKVTIGICDKKFVEEIGKTNEIIKVHVEIDSGMGRTGIKLEDIVSFIKFIQKFSNIEIEGIYTHLSSPDTDDEYSKKQIDTFRKAVFLIKELVPNIKYIHAAASNAILNFKDSLFNLVRPGLILYGYESEKDVYKKINLKPVCKLKSKISFLKTVSENTSISYGRTFITDKKTKIATIPIGYDDGIRRELSNNGYVFINGGKAPIIGRVCMDSCMIDVTNINNPKINDDVWIWNNTNITLDDIANACNTISYEIICNISSRVPRVFY